MAVTLKSFTVESYLDSMRFHTGGVARIFHGGGVGGVVMEVHCVKQRLLTRFVMPTSTLHFTQWMSSESGLVDKPSS